MSNLKQGASVRCVALGWIMQALCSVPAAAQEGEPVFVQAGPDAIVERGAPGSWDRAYNDPGAVLVHDGKLHMFNNGFDGWPTTSGIGYYTSDDGLVWEAQAPGPIFRAAEQAFEGFALVATSALVTKAGQWRILRHAAGRRAGEGSAGQRLATLDR